MNGRVALVTGVSRRKGIGFAIADALATRGAALFLQAFPPYAEGERDAMQLVEQLQSHGKRVGLVEADFVDTAAPALVMRKAIEAFDHVDILVANHAHSGEDQIEHLDAESIDRHLQVNVRASLLLVSEFVRQHDGASGGRIIFLTSGQHLGPMPGEVAYVASKGAMHQVTPTLAHELASRGITVNCVNPGPTDTGWATGEARRAVEERMPSGRWGTPEDAARLAAWLASDEAAWVTGQVIDSEGGFRRGGGRR